MLGGNLRLRVPNEIKLMAATPVKKAIGENGNPFYQTEKTPAPVISDKAVINLPDLKATFVYAILTKPGKEYLFILK